VKDVFDPALITYFKYDQALSLGKKMTLRPGIFLGATFSKSGSPPLQDYFTFGGLMTTNYIETFQDFTGVKFSQIEEYMPQPSK
jgi:hypothetical protein